LTAHTNMPKEEKKIEEPQEPLRVIEPEKIVVPEPELVKSSNIEDDLGNQLTKSQKDELTGGGATDLHSHTPNVSAVYILQAASDSEESAGGTLTKVKEFTVNVDGNIKVVYDAKTGDGTNGIFQVRKNDVTQDQHVIWSSTYTEVSIDLTVAKNDTIQLYIMHNAGTDYAYVRNVRIYYVYPTPPTVNLGGATTIKTAHGVLKEHGDILFMGSTGLKRLAPGTSGQFLQTQGSGADPQWVSALSTTSWVATDTLRHSNDTVRTTSSTTYVKLKEVLLGDDLPVVRIKFTGFVTNHYGNAQIYKNDSPIGTERQLTINSQTFSEDFSGFVAGDKIQIYAKANVAGETAYIRDMRFYYSKKVDKIAGLTVETPTIYLTPPPISFTNQDP